MDTVALFAAFRAEDFRPVFGCRDLTFGGDAIAQMLYRTYLPALRAQIFDARSLLDFIT